MIPPDQLGGPMGLFGSLKGVWMTQRCYITEKFTPPQWQLTKSAPLGAPYVNCSCLVLRVSFSQPCLCLSSPGGGLVSAVSAFLASEVWESPASQEPLFLDSPCTWREMWPNNSQQKQSLFSGPRDWLVGGRIELKNGPQQDQTDQSGSTECLGNPMEAPESRTQEDREVFVTSLVMTFNFRGGVDTIAQAFLSCLVSSKRMSSSDYYSYRFYLP